MQKIKHIIVALVGVATCALLPSGNANALSRVEYFPCVTIGEDSLECFVQTRCQRLDDRLFDLDTRIWSLTASFSIEEGPADVSHLEARRERVADRLGRCQARAERRYERINSTDASSSGRGGNRGNRSNRGNRTNR